MSNKCFRWFLPKFKHKYKFDKWFLVFLAMLLWTLGRVLFLHALQIPNNLTNIGFWGNMVALIIAVFAWIWLFKIYARSVRVDDTKPYPQALKDVVGLMRRTTIGHERSVPDNTEIWFLFKEEYEALMQGKFPKKEGKQ